MKVRKAKKRFEPKPKIQPKRNDLNTQQMGILDKIKEAPDSLIQAFEDLVVQLNLDGLEKAENGSWDPGIVSLKLGISLPTMDNYIHHYLRVIRRPDETAKDYTLRKRASEFEESPLEETPAGFYRWMNSRMFLFVVAAVTKVNQQAETLRTLRETVKADLGIPLGEARRIPSFETQVHTFEVTKDQ